MKQIYTRTGDQGMTSLHGGIRVSKTDPRIKTNGSIDHLNSTLGVLRAFTEVENRYFPAEYNAILRDIQHDLMKIMAIVATIPSDTIHGLAPEYVSRIETLIDTLTAETRIPQGFVIPGGGRVSALLHLARTDARNAEICLWEVNEKYKVDENILAYINRISDLMFVMAVSIAEENDTWTPTGHN